MMSTTEVLDRLNRYTGDDLRGLIINLPVDLVASYSVDLAGAIDVFVFRDGTEFRRDRDGVWRVA